MTLSQRLNSPRADTRYSAKLQRAMLEKLRAELKLATPAVWWTEPHSR